MDYKKVNKLSEMTSWGFLLFIFDKEDVIMRKLLSIIYLCFVFSLTQAQDIPPDSGVFLLHKFEQNIGKETYTSYNHRNSKTYVVDFRFVDRGSPVPLKANVKVNSAGDPLELVIKGSTSRFSTVNDSIVMKGNIAFLQVNDSSYTKQLTPHSFPITGYSPAIVQQLLLQYWHNKKQPANITTLPFGALQIKMDGTDNVALKGKELKLNRYIISGLIWGNELLWTDSKGRLICILTIDAEGDKTEMMREEYETLLPELIKRAAGYGMATFAKAGPSSKSAAGKLAIRGGDYIDVENGFTVPNGVMLIDNGKIVSINKSVRTPIPEGARVVDATGKIIMPGLWDMHAHFEQTEWGPAYLAAGVTTVRDCGNELGFIDAIQKAIDNGKGIGPKILMAGIIDGKGPEALGIIQADTKEEAIQAVETYKARGFDQIKIYSSVKPAIVKAICDQAHKQGLSVTGHIPDGMNLKSGVDSGMNMVNHLQYVYSMMKRNPDRSINFNDSVSEVAIKFIKDHKVVIDPTIGVYDISLRDVKGDITKMEPAFYSLPLPLQTQFANTGEDSATHAKYLPMLNSLKVLIKRLYEEGVPIVAGTDMGFPGFSLARELELYVDGGLTPAQVIRTATIIPAQVMKMADKTGSIAVGKNADLIIVDGNPLSRINYVRNVKVVIKGGRVYDPVALHKMVGFSK